MKTRALRLGWFSLFCSYCLASSLLVAQGTQSQNQTEGETPTYKAAVIVENRVGDILEDRVRSFEDRIIASVTGNGLSVISREDVLSGLKETNVDEAFSKQSSAIRLAQNLGADYLLVVTLLSLDHEYKSFEGYGVGTKNVTYSLEAGYRLVSLVKGASVQADTVRVYETIRQSANMEQSGTATLSNLLSRAARELGSKVQQAVPKLTTAETPGYVEVYIEATMQDFNIPDVVRGEDGQYRITANAYQLEVFGADIEVNGLLIGTTSATEKIRVPAGVNRLRISRAGYEPVERMVNFFPNQRLLINMRLDDKGMERLQEMVVFLNGLKQSAALTQAEVDRIEGIATYFKQSGIRLDHRSDVNVDQRSDHKSDIKVDTKEGIEVHQTQNSLFR